MLEQALLITANHILMSLQISSTIYYGLHYIARDVAEILESQGHYHLLLPVFNPVASRQNIEAVSSGVIIFPLFIDKEPAPC